MTIEILKEDVKKELIQLENSCFGPSHWEMDLWDEIFSDLERNVIYGIKVKDRLVAYLMIYNWGKERDYVKLTNLAVSEEYRNKKYASELMRYMLDHMRSSGIHDFRGETRVSNYSMQKVFENFGFERKEVMKDYYDDPTEDALKYVSTNEN